MNNTIKSRGLVWETMEKELDETIKWINDIKSNSELSDDDLSFLNSALAKMQYNKTCCAAYKRDSQLKFLSNVGRSMGISRERARQLLRAGFAKIKKIVNEKEYFDEYHVRRSRSMR